MKDNIVFKQVLIEKIATEGKSIARVNGQVIFVSGVAPGDIIDLRIVKKKKNYSEGVVIRFQKYSIDRVEAFCQYFDICGGCQWQHLPYNLQLKFKTQQIIDNMRHIGKIDFPIPSSMLESSKQTYYRNKLEFTFSATSKLKKQITDSSEIISRNALGFHTSGKFDKVVDIEHCYLQAEPSNKIRNWLRSYALNHNLSFFNLITHKGYLRVVIIRTSSTGQNMVILQVAEDNPSLLIPLLDALISAFPEITSLYYLINAKRSETFHDLRVYNYSGLPYIEESMPIKKGAVKKLLTFRIGPKSFFQTNSKQAYELYKIVLSYSALTGKELVYDLYTGAGTIANFLASYSKNVIGIDYIKAAIKDAKINSSINKIANTTFYAGDIKDILNDELMIKHGKPDVIITDPPRAGMLPSVVNMLLKIEAQRIVYISCNSATQARDLALLIKKYKIKKMQPIDIFPQTHHVENVVLLELKS